jgi:hypothetical protein
MLTIIIPRFENHFITIILLRRLGQGKTGRKICQSGMRVPGGGKMLFAKVFAPFFLVDWVAERYSVRSHSMNQNG